ncbi:MAG: nucleotidyltransferase domain-containing protein [bacterium]
MDKKKYVSIAVKHAKRYLNELRKHNINVKKAYIYGSYAKKTFNEFSDIDLAVISDDFTGDRFEDAIKIIPYRRKIDNRIEPMPYRSEDFNKEDPLVTQILKTGVKVK